MWTAGGMTKTLVRQVPLRERCQSVSGLSLPTFFAFEGRETQAVFLHGQRVLAPVRPRPVDAALRVLPLAGGLSAACASR